MSAHRGNSGPSFQIAHAQRLRQSRANLYKFLRRGHERCLDGCKQLHPPCQMHAHRRPGARIPTLSGFIPFWVSASASHLHCKLPFMDNFYALHYCIPYQRISARSLRLLTGTRFSNTLTGSANLSLAIPSSLGRSLGQHPTVSNIRFDMGSLILQQMFCNKSPILLSNTTPLSPLACSPNSPSLRLGAP